MLIHDIATLAGLGRTYYLVKTRLRPPTSGIYRPIHDQTHSLFIHVPKTAGVSFHRAMYGNTIDYGHAPAMVFRRRDPDRFARYWKFAFMRDPLDRFVSAFYYLKTAPIDERSRLAGERLLTPYETVSDLIAAMRRNPWIRARIMSWIHFVPQHWFLTDPSNRVLVDFIGRSEEFDATLPRIAEKLGVPFEPARQNRSQRPRDLALSGPERDFLRDLYRVDQAIYDTRSGLESWPER